MTAQLEIANAKNIRLAQENALLRQQLEDLKAETHANAVLHVEAKLNAFRLQDEHERMYEILEKLKHKYNQLHDAYLVKVKRCKALEEVFQRQKTLSGLVVKTAFEQKQKEQTAALQTQHNKYSTESSNLEALVQKLQVALDEAYDVIDELEFELESVDFLEMENQRLQNELAALKKDKQQNLRSVNSPVEQTDTADGDYDEPAVYRQSHNEATALRCKFASNVSSLADTIVGDLDPEIMERSVLTESLMKTIESESNCLRRELLRARLRKTNRAINRPSSSTDV